MGCSRQEYWSGLPVPPSGDLPDPEIKPTSPTSPALDTEPTVGEPVKTEEGSANTETLGWKEPDGGGDPGEQRRRGQGRPGDSWKECVFLTLTAGETGGLQAQEGHVLVHLAAGKQRMNGQILRPLPPSWCGLEMVGWLRGRWGWKDGWSQGTG